MNGSLETTCIVTSQRTFNNYLILFWDVGERKCVKVSRINALYQFLDWVMVQSSSYTLSFAVAFTSTAAEHADLSALFHNKPDSLAKAVTIIINKRKQQRKYLESKEFLHIFNFSQSEKSWNSNWMLGLILSCASVNFPFVSFHLHRRSWVGRSKTNIPVGALLNHTQYSAYCIWHKIVTGYILQHFLWILQSSWILSQLSFMEWISPNT